MIFQIAKTSISSRNYFYAPAYIALCINIAVIFKINNILHDDYQPQHEIS